MGIKKNQQSAIKPQVDKSYNLNQSKKQKIVAIIDNDDR